MATITQKDVTDILTLAAKVSEDMSTLLGENGPKTWSSDMSNTNKALKALLAKNGITASGDTVEQESK